MVKYIRKLVKKHISLPVLRTIRPILLTVIFLSIISDILLVAARSDIIIFSILAMYVFSIVVFRIRSRLTFSFSLLLLFIMYAQYIIFIPDVSPGAEKAAVWLFFFLGIGMIQQWKELRS